MDFGLPLKAFLVNNFDVNSLNGVEKYLVLCVLLSGGAEMELTHQQVKKQWSKTVMKIAYNPSQHHRALNEGWVKSVANKPGMFAVTPSGYDYLEEIQTSGGASITGAGGATRLEIFTVGKTHSFDKFLRTIFSAAAQEVMIADAYVDDTIFDNLLDKIPETVIINLLYGNAQGVFGARARRFKGQYSGFSAKTHSSLHDRFLIIDNVGYIIGPSLKDAARKSPATVVRLSPADTKKLRLLFNGLWSQGRT